MKAEIALKFKRSYSQDDKFDIIKKFSDETDISGILDRA